MSDKIKKVVLAYSGGLDTSIILKWLIETYDCEVVAYVADLGQGEELEEARQKGMDTGASQVIIDDLVEEFVADYVFPAFRAGAIYETQYLLGTSLARPIIAKGQVAAARATGGDAVSHGATGKGNDQVRFELGYQALAPDLAIIAPWREWDLDSREALVAYAEKHGIPVPVTKEKPYSSDRNLLHISFEGGVLEDPWAAPPDDMFVLSVSPQDAPDTPLEVRGRRPGGHRRPEDVARGHPDQAQRAGRGSWRGPGGHGGKPLRGHEEQGSVRNPGRRHPAPGPSGPGDPVPGPRGAQDTRQSAAPLQ